ncbi:MAG: hypothetical protein AAGG48_32295 [Planctomycetota bacterium]
MPDFKLHTPHENNSVSRYECGLIAGQQVVLRKDLVIRDHTGSATGKVHPAGETWHVLAGVRSDSVVWFRQPDGSRHTWDDDAESISEWFHVRSEDA